MGQNGVIKKDYFSVLKWNRAWKILFISNVVLWQNLKKVRRHIILPTWIMSEKFPLKISMIPFEL